MSKQTISNGIKREFELYERCHVNTNQEGDRFVGIKIDTNLDRPMVFFPLGYDLPKNDSQLRLDIRHLIKVILEFTSNNERVKSSNKRKNLQDVEFPINAYKNIIEYYFNIGGKYYVENETYYINASKGKQNWGKTIKKNMPIIQRKDQKTSYIYTEYQVRVNRPNAEEYITQLNRFCVYEAFKRIGWMYVDFMPEKPKLNPNVNAALSILQMKISSTNDDQKRVLFQSMKDMLTYIDTGEMETNISFGTEDFEYIWEKLIDRAFGIKNKTDYLPQSRWILDYGNIQGNHPLIPDTIMLHKDKCIILDAKCYKYGITGIAMHLPNGSSINKQITYGEYVEKYKSIPEDKIFNAFVMPYNKNHNTFGLNGFVENIGEAIGEWRFNKKCYERIQGILMDTRDLMCKYSNVTNDDKENLTNCIYSGINRNTDCKPYDSKYIWPTASLELVAESEESYYTKTLNSEDV